MNKQTFFQRHSIAVYFFLAYLISWLGVWIFGGPIFLQGEAFTIDDVMSIGLFVLLGPSVAGIFMTLLVDGTTGLRDLLRRMVRWRVRWIWYLPLLVFPILITALSFALAATISPDFTPTFFAFGIVMGLFAGLIEEIGWMGFVYPKMESKNGVPRASISLGFIWGLWHFLPGFLGTFASLGGYYLPQFIGFVLSMMATRVLIVWVYTHTESLLLSQLMHASSTGFLSVLTPMDQTPVNQVIFYGAYAFVLWIVVGIIIRKYGKNLGKPE